MNILYVAAWKNGRYSVETKVLLRVGACTFGSHFVLVWNCVSHWEEVFWEQGARENIYLEMCGGCISPYSGLVVISQ